VNDWKSQKEGTRKERRGGGGRPPEVYTGRDAQEAAERA